MQVKVPRSVFEMEKSLAEAKQILHRLDKGEKLLKDAVERNSVGEAYELAKLFHSLAHKLNDVLEDASFKNEMLITGRTTVIDRTGRANNSIEYNPYEHRIVDLFTLKSMKELERVFGEENIVEFETIP